MVESFEVAGDFYDGLWRVLRRTFEMVQCRVKSKPLQGCRRVNILVWSVWLYNQNEKVNKQRYLSIQTLVSVNLTTDQLFTDGTNPLKIHQKKKKNSTRDMLLKTRNDCTHDCG